MTAAAALEPPDGMHWIPLEDLDESPLQHRRHYDASAPKPAKRAPRRKA